MVPWCCTSQEESINVLFEFFLRLFGLVFELFEFTNKNQMEKDLAKKRRKRNEHTPTGPAENQPSLDSTAPLPFPSSTSTFLPWREWIRPNLIIPNCCRLVAPSRSYKIPSTPSTPSCASRNISAARPLEFIADRHQFCSESGAIPVSSHSHSSSYLHRSHPLDETHLLGFSLLAFVH